jgi:hypothetical protein
MIPATGGRYAPHVTDTAARLSLNEIASLPDFEELGRERMDPAG